MAMDARRRAPPKMEPYLRATSTSLTGDPTMAGFSYVDAADLIGGGRLRKAWLPGNRGRLLGAKPSVQRHGLAKWLINARHCGRRLVHPACPLVPRQGEKLGTSVNTTSKARAFQSMDRRPPASVSIASVKLLGYARDRSLSTILAELTESKTQPSDPGICGF